MAGPFQGLSMASNALRNFQRALDTTGHNIANVNTEGYSRQSVQFGANTPLDFYSRGIFQVGQGSSITSINRVRDSYLDASMRNSMGNSGRSYTAATGFKNIDQIYGEPSDYGVAASLDKFFNAWSGLGSNPSDPAALANVRSSAQTLTDTIRTKYTELKDLETGINQTVNATLSEIDRLGQEIAGLNKEIMRTTGAGGTANDLMDRRDLAVEKLSGLVNIQKEVFPDGQYAIYAAGHTLVDSGGLRPFPKSFDAASGTVTDGSIVYNVRNGALAGHMISLNAISDQKGRLDSLANNLRTQINGIHQTGTNQLGNTGVLFFNDSLPQSGAIDFDLSVDVKADAKAIVSGISGEIGDGGLALSIAQLRDSQVSTLGNRTFSDFFQSAVSEVAFQASYFENAAATEDAVHEQIENQRQAVSGVSLDDEMAAMMKYQRSYQAAAKALTVFDQIAEDLIGMLRR